MAKKAEIHAVEDEVPAALVVIEFNGHTFTIPRNQDEWPTKAIIAASRRQFDQVVEQVLGAAQWDVLMNTAAPAYKQFVEFLGVFADAVERECIKD